MQLFKDRMTDAGPGMSGEVNSAPTLEPLSPVRRHSFSIEAMPLPGHECDCKGRERDGNSQPGGTRSGHRMHFVLDARFRPSLMKPKMVVLRELRPALPAQLRMKRLTQAMFIALVACSPQPVAQTSNDVATIAPSEPLDDSAQRPMAAPPGRNSTVASEDAVVVPATSQRQTLAVDSEGLRWFLSSNGSARPLPFGAPRAAVLRSLEDVRGPAGTGRNENCGAGPVEYASWPDGLSLVFQNDRFAGWGLDSRATGALATANGVGPGTNRRELADSFGSVTFRKTSLGTEFDAGGLFGVLDGAGPGARITDMWAGVSCVAR